MKVQWTRNFDGSLNTNEFYNALYNAYRLFYVYADNLKGIDEFSLAEKYRTDGGMYEDQSVFTDMDVLYSRVWDPNDTNVLAPEAVVEPKQEKITVDKFRQIGLYTDEYLSKRAWMSPYQYDEFRSVVQKQVSETKKVYEQRLVDVFVGCIEFAKSTNPKMNLTITLPTDTDTEKQNRLQSMEIAKTIGDVLTEMADTTTNYNVNKFLKRFDESDIDIIWNANYYNKIRYVDLPTIFHKDELLKKGIVRPARYFGNVNSSPSTADGTTTRSADEYFIPVASNGEYAAAGPNVVHVFPGDLLPKSTPVTLSNPTYATLTATVNGVSRTLSVCTKASCYVEDSNIICKLVHKNAIKYMSSFETGTEFFNPKNLTKNRYLTWAYAEPVALRGYPIVTIRAAQA